MKTALYPGTFDPITYGHIDIAKRASQIFYRVIAVVAENPSKNPLFNVTERLEMVNDALKDVPNIEVISYNGLIVNCLQEYNGSAIIRGLRALSDFEYEFQMALMNRELNKRCETLFMMPNPAYTFVSSRLIKEIINHSGNIEAFVPEIVINALKRKVAAQ